MSDEAPLRLFEGYGIELEYMIVDAGTLDVRPIADRLLHDAQGQVDNEIEHGRFAWSNELARHVIELKTNGPARQLAGLAAGFQDQIARVARGLAPHDARLLPTAMHPWMDPVHEFELWPYGDRVIYRTFDRIFGCAGHGWANLQSAHLNLPFADDDEFGRLHAAIRAVLPLLPALAAASPFVEGGHAGRLDERLFVYATNAQRVPSIAGAVVPEPVFTRAGYEALLESIYADLAPLDPDGILRHEWVNARGAIARFDRMAIEIRVLDVQECPLADLAIAHATSRVLERLSGPDEGVQHRLRALDTGSLAATLHETARAGGDAVIGDGDHLAALGLDPSPRPAREVWRALVERDVARAPDPGGALDALGVLVDEGCLAERLLRRVGERPAREALRALYGELAECLAEGRLLRAPR